MARYSRELSNILSSIKLHQIDLFIDKLGIDEIKILQSSVLPIVKDLERRRYLKKNLAKQEQIIFPDPLKSEVIVSALQQDQSISELFKNLFDGLFVTIISDLKTDEIRELFLKRITDDELFILNRKLISSPLGNQDVALSIALESEFKRRFGEELAKEYENIVHVQKKRKQGFSQFESKAWKGIINQVNQVKLEVTSQNPVPTKSPISEPHKPWYFRLWSALKSIFYPIVIFFSWLGTFFTSTNSKQTQPVVQPVVLTEEEKIFLENLRITGAQNIAAITGVTAIGEIGERNKTQIELSIRSRFGMSIAAQVVAGTENEHHRKLMNAADSLVQPGDSNDTIRRMYKAINSVTTDKSASYPLRAVDGEHIYARGAYSLLVTALESEVMSALVEQSEDYSRLGLQLSQEEAVSIKQYHENMQRSKDLMHVMQPITSDWGGYKKVDGQYIKVEEEFDKKQAAFEQKLALAGKYFQQQCLNLKDGQALYIDTGLDGHAMQLVIKKIGNEYKLSTYDSSGALENTELRQGSFFGFSPLGLIKLNGMGEKAKRKNAYTFTVPQASLQSNNGLDYLTYLIRTNTMAGWAETTRELNARPSTASQRANMGFFERINALNELSKKYTHYKKMFGSIALPDSPPHFEEVLQRPQNTQNCFAKKAQSCQLYELGVSTYKKVRLAVLLEQKERLIQEACGVIEGEEEGLVPSAYSHMIETIEPEYLSPSELYEKSTRLTEVREIPSPQYYKKYFDALLEVREQLARFDAEADVDANLDAIKRIDDKIASHANELYTYLSSANPPRNDEIKAIFVPEVFNKTFDWTSGEIPLTKDEDGGYSRSLQHLSDYSAAQAWKTIIQILNHQIKKLSVNERTLSSSSERLSSASFRYARNVTLNDLENANIVTFTSGFYRTDLIKIEININGSRQEISKDTFFKLVVQNKTALTNPKVMGLLDYLRNASQEIEKRYQNEVYPKQIVAFKDKLLSYIKKAELMRIEAISKLYEGQIKLEDILLKCDRNLDLIKKEIEAEGNPGRGEVKSVKLKNLILRQNLLEAEREQIQDLSIYVATKIQEMNGNKKGSSQYKINEALDVLEKLKSNNVDYQSINARCHVFTQTRLKLERVEQSSEEIVEAFEVGKIEQEINSRVAKINEYRHAVINNHLQTNVGYRILDELSAGRMGTDKNRNKEMYSQTTATRMDFFKQGRNNFQEGSTFQEIQSLNHRLKVQVQEMVERRVILKSNFSNESDIEALTSDNDEYINIEQNAQKACAESIPQQIKDEWVRESFIIWLKHIDPELVYSIHQNNKGDPTDVINQCFHQFLEQKGNIKYAELKGAGFPIELGMDQIEELGWHPISTPEIEDYREMRKVKAGLILQRFKAAMNPVLLNPLEVDNEPEPIKLQGNDLSIQHTPSLESVGFTPPSITFLTQRQRAVLDGGTLKFLREHPTPVLKGDSKAQCVQYVQNTIVYLHKLKAHSGLENKEQRILEFCHSTASTIFDLPYPPSQELITEMSNTLIDRYRDDEGKINEAFLKLENNERIQIVATLIKLNLSRINPESTKVNIKFYSTIKQWEKLISPPDETLSKRISLLTSGGIKPEDISLLKEVDLALHESPISLEGLYEGQKGLQIALDTYGKEKGVDASLRKLADRLGMRNGDALLVHQFIDYYSNPQLILSSDGMNSTQGRELFSRALLDALQHAPPDEKQQLVTFLQGLRFEDESSPCKLKTPHQVFIEEQLIRILNLAPNLFKENAGAEIEVMKAEATDLFISTLTNSSNDDGVDRLFGFAKEINATSLRIERALQSKPVDSEELDMLYSKLICSNLAYQLILDQASEEVLVNLKNNFEYTREMSLVQANINKLHENLVQFSSNLNICQRATLKKAFDDYLRDKKFDGQQKNVTSIAPLNIPGFISLGQNKSLDVLHGVIYIGNYKLGVMPAYIQSNIVLQELGINNLPFKPQDGRYVYLEGQEVRASITQLSGGELVVQRELHTLDGTTEMLQYIEPDNMDSLPMSLRRRLKAEHFFLDVNGFIHAYNSDFTPVFKLSNKDELWSGVLLDHHGNKVSISMEDTNGSLMTKEITKIFPKNELVSVNERTVYVPAIAKYIIHNDKTGNYLITDSLKEGASQRHLKITVQGVPCTEKELTSSELVEMKDLTKHLEELRADSALITKSDLLSRQTKAKVEKSIKACEHRINDLNAPEYFVFVPDSATIKDLEEEQKLLSRKMQQVYFAFREGGKNKDKLGASYEQTKADYLQGKKRLKQAYANADHIRTYYEKQDQLQAKDFQSILHVGLIPGKTELLTKLLGANVPVLPLKNNELDELRQLKSQYKEPLTMDERFALLMTIGTELQHHLLEREAVITGKLQHWDKDAYLTLVGEFNEQAKQINDLSGIIPLSYFSNLWRSIRAEFSEHKDLQVLFTKPVIITPTGERKPVNINTKTTNMPIESISGRTLIQFKLYDDPQSLIDAEQIELEQRLRKLEDPGKSNQAQEEGYYYENYGLFNNHTLERLFSLTSEHQGINGLTEKEIAGLLKLMEEGGWIRHVKGSHDQYQVTQHPSEFYSAGKVASYLAEIGFERNQIREISERLEIFFYQTVVSGGNYSIKTGAREELISKTSKEQERCNLEYLMASDKLESMLAKASPKITFADLNSAYLLNDFSRIIANFPEKERYQTEITLNNAMTRMLYYKTELDHLNDVQDTFKMKQDEKAISMLHIRRNYNLDKLLDSVIALEDVITEKDKKNVEQERKMQRAFLLFEYEFGHRCNARQVNIFRGLLLDDKTNPDKIDSAQARMGFGKTTLLPLVALYKTGNKLVRFVVPKSALETNTGDMSSTLSNILGSRAVKEDFQRYRIISDPEPNMGEASPRLKSLQDIKADLKKKLALYQTTRDNREVLVEAPNVRNSMECQAKIFLDLFTKLANEPLQQKELFECISVLNEIRSITSVTIFDELDATQDSATTDVNYTSGDKIPLDSGEIYPLELIAQTITATPDKGVANLAKVLLARFNIDDEDERILKYVTSLDVPQPISEQFLKNSTSLYLIRAVLSDPVMLSIFTEKEPGTDFGVWFENASDGAKLYDYESLKSGKDTFGTPLLIAIPYAAANIPKPRGSRFDNPEVTAFTTLLYYLDPRTELNEVPHLEFLIESFRQGIGETPFLAPSGEQIEPEFNTLFHEIKALAEIEDPIVRNAAREKYFAQLEGRIKNKEIPATAFRKMLARTIIQEQIKFDAGKANSNRYEQGTNQDEVIGFSGTAGDTSSYFNTNLLDPAADGNMTLGIMGRANCQSTTSINTAQFTETGEDYTTNIIKQLALNFLPNTRALIDVGGLCKTSNRSVAREIALQLKAKDRTLKGIIFYDDVTNTKKLLTLDALNKEKIVDLTTEMMAESDRNGSYFTYYDQSHSRGADIKQMDKAHAVLTLNFTVTNNGYKQAIMRLRKIIDKTSGQSFSIAVPDILREKIINDLGRDADHQLTGNDIAFWLRQKELKSDLNNVSVLMLELDSVVKNAILQQQAELTKLIPLSNLTQDEIDKTLEQIDAFRECARELNTIIPFISGSLSKLEAKYGNIYGTVKKEEFIRELRESLDKRLTTVFDVINRTRETMSLPLLTDQDSAPYKSMADLIIHKREPQLSKEFNIASAQSALTEVQSETENQSESQSESQSQSQTQTHSFSEVSNEEVVVDTQLRKHDITLEPITIDYLMVNEELADLPLASSLEHMHHLFNEDDPVRCSPIYRMADKSGYLSPPVHYFLVREEGNPKVILINQDEANLFKAAPTAPWSLYNIREELQGRLIPVAGPGIVSLNESLLKKLHFSAIRHEIKGNDLDSLAKSFEGICTPQQLQPSLNIDLQTNKELHGQDAVFTLPKWGFYGKNQQNISIEVEQTQITFNDKYEKRGVTISIGKGDEQSKIFISSKLNKRILAGAENREKGSNRPKLKEVARQIKQDYSEAMEERKQLREQLKNYKDAKKGIFVDFDARIEKLEETKAEAVRQAKTKMSGFYVEGMKGVINLREHHEKFLAKNIDTLSRMKLVNNKEWGTRIGWGKFFNGIEPMVTHYLNEILQLDRTKGLKPDELNKKLDDCITEIHLALSGRYENLAVYSRQNSALMDVMYAATTSLSKDINLWDIKFDSALKGRFADLHAIFLDREGKSDEEKLKIWMQFESVFKETIINAKGKNLSFEDFDQLIYNGMKQFATNNKTKIVNADVFISEIMNRLHGSFTSSEDKLKNTKSIQTALANIITNRFIQATKVPSEVQRDLYLRIYENLSARKAEVYLPEQLKTPHEGPISKEELSASLQEALQLQNMHVTSKIVSMTSQKLGTYVAGYKWLEHNMEHFTPVKDRTSNLGAIDGFNVALFPPAQNELARLDEEVLLIQKEIDDAKFQKSDQLAELDSKYRDLPEKIQNNNKKFAELKNEKSALNKLLSGIKKLLSVFSNHQVTVVESSIAESIDTGIIQDAALDLLDDQFNLETIIRDDVSASALLTFVPPELYDVEDDLKVQEEHLHGLDEREALAKKTMDGAIAIVRGQAGLLRKREYAMHQQLVNDVKEQQLNELEIPAILHPGSMQMKHDVVYDFKSSEPVIPIEEVAETEPVFDAELFEEAQIEVEQRKERKVTRFLALKADLKKEIVTNGDDESADKNHRTSV